MNTRSCNVGLFQPKTFQVPVTDLYIFINVDLETGPVVHVLCPGCSRNPSPSLRGRRARTWGSSMKCQGDVGILPELSMSCSSASGPRFAAVLVSDGCVECWTLCAPLSGHCFRSHHSLLWLSHVSDHITTAVIPSQFACKETIFKRKNKLHFIFP